MNKAERTDQASMHNDKGVDENATGYLSPAQIKAEEDLGLGPESNLPAPPEDQQPFPNPDTTAVSSMEHTKGPHASRNHS